MRAGSTNRLELTPDPAASSVTVALTVAGTPLPIAAVPVADGGTWYVDISSEELPAAGSEVAIDWRIARIVGDTEQVRTVSLVEWVEGYDTDPTYSAYRRFSDVISYDEWPRYLNKAWRVVSDVTYDRAADATSDDDIAAVHLALYVAADALAGNSDVRSETYGRYRVEYGDARQSPYEAARNALAGTGLTYAGML